MRLRNPIRWMLAVLLPAASVAPAGAGVGRLADIEVYDRDTGRLLPVYWHQGRHYIAGQPGHAYEIRVRNRGDGRLLVVTSVDGVNVVTGQTASPTQGGYVLEAYGNQRITGWRKSLDRIAAFYFTPLPDSYAARTGRPDNVGVIGVAVFREPPSHRPPHIAMERPGRGVDAVPSAPAGRAADGGAAPSMAPAPQEKLGTGHGRSEWSPARYTEFHRRSSQPDEIIELWYDSEARLVAMGVVDAPPYRDPDLPSAFPSRFVPDPPSRW